MADRLGTLDKLNKNDTRLLLIWILAGLLGASVAYKYFYRAFPEASVDFKVPRADALEQAKQFAGAQGAQLGGYDSSIVFDLDDTAKTYLEREVGLAAANKIMKNDVHIWYWQTRFFRPLQKEEFDVRVDPTGGVVGYNHVLAETAPGARLERAAAQAVAESFLRDGLHKDLSRYDFREEEANFTERPSRRDWSFSWEERGFRAKDASYRLTVALAGDQVDGYAEFLKVPEAWKIGYEHLRSSNNLFEFVALIPYAFLFGGCLYVIVSLGRQGLLEWRMGLSLGIFLTVLYFVMTMNQWPIDRATYDTNTPYASFFLSQAGQAALISVVSALMVVLAIVPGEHLYRISQPDKIRVNVGLSLPGIRTKEFFRANVIGICLAATHIGYITVFYIISRRLGAWAPQDLNYENVVSTWIPWVYPLAIGIYAATSEEFLFRLFAIPYLMRLTRSRFLAVVIPAFAWGFLHSNYPQEPAYIRGIEVGLIGIVAGLVMLRWGIWATLTWHYTVDAFLISTSLLTSHGAYLRISGAVVGGGALIPLIIAATFYLRRGGFETDGSLLNSAQPIEALPASLEERVSPGTAPQEVSPGIALRSVPEKLSTGYQSMSSRALVTLVVCGLLGIALITGLKREAVGDFIRFQIDANEAVALGDATLRNLKVDPSTYHHAATITYTFDGYTNEYLRRTIGVTAANGVYRERVPSAFWTVRYFRDSQNEEYMVVLRPDGSLHSVHHTLDEKSPGANLPQEEALARAEAYLIEQKKIDLSRWHVVETNTDKRPARTDHEFEWEQNSAIDGISGDHGAHIRVQLHVQGDEVSGYRIYIKIPEAWRDAESRTSSTQTTQTFARTIAIAFVLIAVLVIFLRNLKSSELGQIPWKRYGKWSIWMLLAGAVITVNRLPQLMASYTTTTSLAMYYATLGISLLFIVSLYISGAVLLLGLACFILQRAFGAGRIPGFMGERVDYYRDALIVALFGSAAVMGLNRLPILFARWSLLRHTLDVAVPSSLDVISPAASVLASSIASSFLMAGVIGLAAGLITLYVRPIWMRFSVMMLYAVLTTTNVATAGAFFRGAAYQLVVISLIWLGVKRLVRFNVMGYFLLAALLTLAPTAIELLKQPNSFFRANGYAVAAFALVILALPLVQWQRTQNPSVE